MAHPMESKDGKPKFDEHKGSFNITSDLEDNFITDKTNTSAFGFKNRKVDTHERKGHWTSQRWRKKKIPLTHQGTETRRLQMGGYWEQHTSQCRCHSDPIGKITRYPWIM